MVLLPHQKEAFEQSGDYDTGFTLPSGQRFRLNIARQQSKISIVARAIPTGNFEMQTLGLPDVIQGFVNQPSGIILVTGATGSGKSTTLASWCITSIKKIESILLPLKIPLNLCIQICARITQREVGADTESFHEALRRVVRQSPDVILIGEMRDKETISVALSAALTGHLVLSTVHIIDATQTFEKVDGLLSRESARAGCH